LRLPDRGHCDHHVLEWHLVVLDEQWRDLAKIGTVSAAAHFCSRPTRCLFQRHQRRNRDHHVRGWDQTSGTNGTNVNASATGGSTAFFDHDGNGIGGGGTVANPALTSGNNTVFFVSGANSVTATETGT